MLERKERPPVMNQYESLGNGMVVGNDKAMHLIAKTFDKRVLVCRQVMSLSYLAIHEAFGGVKGKEKLDGLRAMMVEDIASWPGAVSHWRESAHRVRETLAQGVA